ncbi:MAG: magnesium transporter [Planctomycetes bacterium]|nr:magnesium transporter [Planctomycetota bacterium]
MEPTSPRAAAELLKSHDLHPSEVADFLEDRELREIVACLSDLDEQDAADVVEHLDLAIQRALVDVIPHGHMAKVIERMAPDVRADLIKELPDEVADGLLPLIAQAERQDIARLAAYEEDTAGSVMTTEYAVVNLDDTVAMAREELRRQAPGEETGYYVYVIDSGRRLIGIVSLRELLLARSDQHMEEIVDRDYVSINAEDDQDTLGDIFSRYELPSVPVTDEAGRLVGRITADDVIDVVEEEADEDIYHLGAAGRPIDYLRSSVLRIARERITWLLILVVTGLITSTLLQHYRGYLDQAVVLVIFIPLLMGSGGNAGSQTTAVIIRGLSTGEIEMHDVWRVVFKEMRVGLLVGLALGVCAAGRALLTHTNGGGGPVRLGLTVGLAMIATVTLAKTLGAVLPILFKKIHLDPALMSAPFISSIVDVVTVIGYFVLADLIYFPGSSPG